MPWFQYTYLNAQGKKAIGQLEAVHMREAKEQLIHQGKRVLAIKATRPKKISIKRAELIVFTKQLILLLKSGLPLYESLSSLKDLYPKHPFSELLTMFMEKIRSGGTLSTAMSSYGKIFDQFYCSSVLAGEKTGNLEESLRHVVHVLERKEELSKKLLSALSYPCVLLIFSFGIILFFLTSVIPSLQETFDYIELNRTTRCVFALSTFICSYKNLLLISLGFVSVVLYFLLRLKQWRRIIERLIFAFPLSKTFFIKLCLCRFCSVAAAIVRGGGTLIDGLEIGCDAITYIAVKQDLQRVMEGVIQGNTLSQELDKTPWVPKLVTGMVSLGEESGSLAHVLEDIAHIYSGDTQKTLTWIASWSQPIILIFLGGIIGVIMLSILIPLTSSIQAF